VFAINGDYYGFRSTGIVIRNGVLFRDEGARTGLAIYRDGHMEVYDETTTSGQELIDAGVWNTLSFGPALVDGGEIVEGIEEVEVDTNFGNHSIQGEQPRTGIGVIDQPLRVRGGRRAQRGLQQGRHDDRVRPDLPGPRRHGGLQPRRRRLVDHVLQR
jgi:hypothetical protein